MKKAKLDESDFPLRIDGAFRQKTYEEEDVHDHTHTNPVIRPNRNRVRVFLVRHAESEANKDQSLNTIMSDHAIPLSEEGKRQAKVTGQTLNVFLAGTPGCGAQHRRIWTSPYQRTRQTARAILDEIGEKNFGDVQESIFLGEQQFGLFEGLGPKQVATKYPEEYLHFEKAIKDNGRFWARMPLGESRFDVCDRISRVVDQIINDEWHHGLCDVIVISHGLALRAFAMMWLGRTAEWMDAEPNPRNGSIRLFEGTTDKGYIFDGFK